MQAQDTLGVVIQATAQYAPAGDGFSQDAALNLVLSGYSVQSYEQAYPLAKSEAAKNCFRIILNDSEEYADLIWELELMGTFDYVIVEKEEEAGCSTPVAYNDPQVQGSNAGQKHLHTLDYLISEFRISGG